MVVLIRHGGAIALHTSSSLSRHINKQCSSVVLGMTELFFLIEVFIFMLRIINFRVSISQKQSLDDLLCKKMPALTNNIINIKVVRKAVDARKKPNIVFVYTLFVEVRNEDEILRKLKNNKDVSKMEFPVPEEIIHGKIKLQERPIIVGFGPAGMLAALYLAREGYRPIVLERGQDADTRTKDVEEFWRIGNLKPNSNVQFGEGGAGTFSDGKLTTRVTHPRLHEIAKYFVDFGAPEEILFKHKPHVGTDILRRMVINLRRQIISWGGEVRFNSTVTELIIENNYVKGVKINNDEIIYGSHVFMGIGHSARDTYEMLYNKNVEMISKPLAIGVRIEHPQDLIDRSQYGTAAKDVGLGAAEYALVYHDEPSGRTAYTFCMCPGGNVVASASEEGGLVTNGMSCYARNSGIANSALVVSVGPEDYGEHPLAGVEFQRRWEKLAYELGGSNFKAPAQRVGDFLRDEISSDINSKDLFTYKPGVIGADLRKCLPDYVTEVIKRALPYFGRKLKGFDDAQACMTGVETRTSAPLRILRNKEFESLSTRGLYPIGEGAGYAGGIMSAALDGAEAAISFMKEFAPWQE